VRVERAKDSLHQIHMEKTVGLFRGLRVKLGLRRPIWPWPGISIGRHSYGINENSIEGYRAEDNPLTVGSFCSVAQGVLFLCRATHRMDLVSTRQIALAIAKIEGIDGLGTRGPIVVGHDVWIGARAIIMSGVTVGNGAVIGAGSVVTKDIPPYAIVAGSPAKVIRYRFSPDVVDRIQASEWWNWSDERIRDQIKLLTMSGEDFAASFHANIN
jgi:acetyltransferase-like isoleucine patch superfamily enzyme